MCMYIYVICNVYIILCLNSPTGAGFTTLQKTLRNITEYVRTLIVIGVTLVTFCYVADYQ